jgi:hypothetical protein
MPYPMMDYTRLETLPLSQRKNLLDIQRDALRPDDIAAPSLEPALAAQIDQLAQRIVAARGRGASVMMAYGAHLIKNGAGPLVNALVERGFVTHLATQGAGVIHDWEFAFQAASGESVRENAPAGRFGSWEETGRWLNLAVLAGAAEGIGFGEAVGRMIVENGLTIPSAEELRRSIQERPDDELTGARADLLSVIRRFKLPTGRVAISHPFPQYSVLACAYRHRVPMTVHPGIGYDIIVNHPLYHGAAIGRAAATDVRVYAQGVDGLDGGVYMSIGSAIMSPQVFEKAFSAANNLRRLDGRPLLREHYLAIVDLQDGGGWDWSTGEPPSNNPAYYLRYCKSFYRMGGTLDYVRCDNRDFLAALWKRLQGLSVA